MEVLRAINAENVKASCAAFRAASALNAKIFADLERHFYVKYGEAF